METKQRRNKPVRRTPESYRKEVEELTNGEYLVLDEFVNTRTPIVHRHAACGREWKVSPNCLINQGRRCPKCNVTRVTRTTESYRKEVSEATDGEYSVIDRFINTATKIKHRHEICGHTWVITPGSFIHGGSRCPKCTATGVMRSTESYRKEVEEKTNGEFSVLGEFVNTRTKMKFVHNACGTVLEKSPSNFNHFGAACPKCRTFKKRWTPDDYRKEVREATNGGYRVLSDYINSSIKIPHCHLECGHVWQVAPNSFINGGARCPKCTRLKKTDAQFKAEVFDIIGDEYSFLEPYNGYDKKIRARHNTCGFVWELSPNNFLHNKARCPICVNNKRIENRSPNNYRKEVAEVSNGEYKVLEDYINTTEKLKHLHIECGHVWEISPHGFINSGTRCPNCLYSRGEKAVADILDSLSIEYIREHTFEYLGRKRYDFFIPSLNIAIEYDGEQHFMPVRYWGGEEYLESVRQSDALKNDFCDFMEIDLLRIPYWEFDNIDEIVANFIDTVKLMRSISANSSDMAKC